MIRSQRDLKMWQTNAEAAQLDGIYEETLSMLATMSNHPDKWYL